jgi:hypothetical protein
MLTLIDINGNHTVTDTRTRQVLIATRNRAKALREAREEAQRQGLVEQSEALWTEPDGQ